MQEVRFRFKKFCYFIICVMAIGFIYELLGFIGYSYIYIKYFRTHDVYSWGLNNVCVWYIPCWNTWDFAHFGWLDIVSSIFGCIFFAIFINLFVTISKEQTPFNVRTPKILKVEAVVNFFMRCFAIVIRVIGYYITKNNYVTYEGLVYYLSMSFVLYGLARIFEYGIQLQKLSDEII